MFKDKYKNNNYYIKKLEISDFDLLYNIGKNPLIWEQHPENDRWKEEKFKIYFDKGIKNEFGIYGVFDKRKDVIIGSSRFYDFNKSSSYIKVGYTFLIPEYWGTSTNYQLKVLMLNEAYKIVDNVLFDIGKINLRSRRAVEKLGASLLNDAHEINIVYELRKNVFLLIKNKNEQIEFLKILSSGCKKHPAYRAHRKPTGNCHQCVVMWNAKKRINFSLINKHYDSFL